MKFTTLCYASLLATLPTLALAHFPFLMPDSNDGETTLKAYFGHGPEPTDAQYFSRLENAKVSLISADGTSQPLQLKPGDGFMSATYEATGLAAFCFEKHQGLTTRHGRYLSTNYSKAYTGSDAWSIDTSKQLQLDITPKRTDSSLAVTILWEGKPAANLDVVIAQGETKHEGKTDEQGQFTAPIAKPGIYTVQVTRIDAQPGEVDGETYDGLRFISTLCVRLE